MKPLKELESEVKHLESQIRRLREEFDRLRVIDEGAKSDLEINDIVVYTKTQERGKVYSITKCRIGVLFGSGKLRYYKKKNLKKLREDE